MKLKPIFEDWRRGWSSDSNFDFAPMSVKHRLDGFVADRRDHSAATAPADSDNGDAAGAGTFGPQSASLAIGDAYFSQQWHLTGAYGINLALGKVGSVWDDYSGAGIKIGDVDDGVYYTHKDLNNNYRTDLDYDARNKDNDAFASTRGDKHGTTVSGVMSAELNNDGNYGVVGVAWDSDVVGYRMGFGNAGSTAQILDLMSRQGNVDISNNSWGYSGFFYDDFNGATFGDIGKAIAGAAQNGRGGLGTVFDFAAGNDRASGQNVNYHDFQNSPYTIAVAATGANGKVASFSTPGAAVLISAPGVDIVTTDAPGAAGYVIGDFVKASGTSYSTPIVSGVVALMLDANPLLGYRDVQEILAYSARNSDPASSGWQVNGADNWNGGGLVVSHDYGFGLVDAHAAVRLAESWRQQSTFADMVTQTAAYEHASGLAIPDNGLVADTITVPGSVADMTIDRVEISLDITHTWIGQLVVTLTSPDGTVSTLVNHPGQTSSAPNGTSQDNIKFVMDSVQYWDESPVGTWTLTVKDTATGQTGTLNKWSLAFLGDADSHNDTYIYTDAYGGVDGSGKLAYDSADDPARNHLYDAGGIDTLNVSAVSSASIIDLHPGAISSIAGKGLTIDSGTVLEYAFLGDGNDIVLTAIPEPTTAATLIGALGTLVGMQRFRRRKS